MRHPRRNTATIVLTVVGALVILCGTAVASWATTGSGPSRAVAKTSLTVTVDAAIGAADLALTEQSEIDELDARWHLGVAAGRLDVAGEPGAGKLM